MLRQKKTKCYYKERCEETSVLWETISDALICHFLSNIQSIHLVAFGCGKQHLEKKNGGALREEEGGKP